MTATRQHPEQSSSPTTPLGQQSERLPASEDRQRREERVLDAATKLLVRWGYRKTTIDDVAREAGVGKGTIYLHWKDKNELFRAAILRTQQRYAADIQARIAADPEGGLLHRIITHSMLATLSSPLLMAIISGKSDIFNGFVEAYNPGFYRQLASEAEAYILQMQQAGLLRSDLPVASVTYLLTAIRVGMMSAPELIGEDIVPNMEELSDTLSDLIRSWLEPAQLPHESDAGKHIYAAYIDKLTQSARA